MRTALLAVGDELLSGTVIDGNSPFLSRVLLEERGILVEEIRVCGDGLEAVRDALADLARGRDLLIGTGGLGPTQDDRVREALAALAGTTLETDGAAEARLREKLRRRGLAWSESMARQVRIPRGFRALANPVGQALGIQGRIGECRLFLLPGVPAEMEAMFREEVLPAIPRAGETALEVLTAAGEPEAALGERIRPWMEREEPQVGMTAQEGVVRIRILARGPGAKERARAAAEEIRTALGEAFAGFGELSLGEVVVGALAERGLTLAAAESCTGGLLAAAVVDAPGASRVFLGGFVAYANQAKEAWVGVPPAVLREHGAVSEETARALAEGAAARAGADLGVGITGIAGPGGAAPGKPVGTVHLAWRLRGRTCHEEDHFPGGRGQVRRAAVRRALWGILALLRDGPPGRI